LNILLFDMDDVLLKPGGYHRALQQTVRLVAACLGFPPLDFDEADILAFESSGVYSEWDTAAICAALLLKRAWWVNPSIRLPTDARQQSGASLAIPPPNFRRFAALLGRTELASLRPLERAERLLLSRRDNYTPDQAQQLRSILRNARSAEGSLTHCIFQELVLGSQVYTQTYALPAMLDSPSYLNLYDRPLISPQEAHGLIQWLEHPDRWGAIFTSRPSRPLPGVFSTPEAELGAALVGLEQLPILGLGGLLWLSKQRQAGAQAFVKPSPVHVLSALLLALGIPLQTCLEEAASLALEGKASSLWSGLEGARVLVFDDSPAGLESAVSAAARLHAAGVMLQIELIGIAADAAKVEVLHRIGARTYPMLLQALSSLAILPAG